LNGSTKTERRILLIEDSAVLSRRLVDLLSEPGRVAVTAQAATQSEALLKLQEASYDVLVVDIELAEGNGVAVIRQARQLYPPDGQPLIVVLTNYASDFVRDHCFAAGADYFLDKMRDIALLKAVVVDGHSKWTPPSPSH
jgi:CheY-like chemotaxis protein